MLDFLLVEVLIEDSTHSLTNMQTNNRRNNQVNGETREFLTLCTPFAKAVSEVEDERKSDGGESYIKKKNLWENLMGRIRLSVHFRGHWVVDDKLSPPTSS